MKTFFRKLFGLSIPFADLSNLEQRKAIAKDILERLDAAQLVPTHRGYVNLMNEPADQESDLQKLVHAKAACQVCALGGAIVALAHFEDKIKLNYNSSIPLLEGDYKTTRLRLVEIFGEKQTALIETAYEGWDAFNLSGGLASYRTQLSEQDFVAAQAFFEKRMPLPRFRAIWTQVAATGVFDPSK